MMMMMMRTRSCNLYMRAGVTMDCGGRRIAFLTVRDGVVEVAEEGAAVLLSSLMRVSLELLIRVY